MRAAAVICAAGAGKRMGNVNKCLLQLCGKPVLQWSIEAFQNHSAITEIVITAAPDYVPEYESLVQRAAASKVSRIVHGGAERQDSNYNGLRALRPDTDVVLFHNGANPLVTLQEITDVINATEEHGAAVVAVPARDTIRRADAQCMSKGVVPRDDIRLMQTPQGLRYDLARRAFQTAEQDGFKGTDDVQLAERLGNTVKIVPAHPHNFKITIPEDVPLAEFYVQKRIEAGRT